jgi:G:T-mismatch repair DNA endonuclease (very short patch repair protein)
MPTCKNKFKNKSSTNKGIYCSRICYGKAYKGKKKPKGFGEKVSKSSKGKPKPWNLGENNPNYKNKGQNKYREKFLESIKNRDYQSPARLKQNKLHSERMKGSSNWMRGKFHSEETRLKLSKGKKESYRKGLITVKKIKISTAEIKINEQLKEKGYETITQYQIPGVEFIYDIYLPKDNIVIEYNGDYWHCNPKKYPADYRVPFPRPRLKTAQDIWKRDSFKKYLAQKAGCKILIIWESDYKKMGIDHILEKIENERN